MTCLHSDYVEYNGTEKDLEDLLMWWGTRVPWEHSDDCDEPKSFHCCEGVFKYPSLNSLQASDNLVYYSEPRPIPLTFGDWQGNLFEVEFGDRIYYRGEGIFELTDNKGNVKSGSR